MGIWFHECGAVPTWRMRKTWLESWDSYITCCARSRHTKPRQSTHRFAISKEINNFRQGLPSSRINTEYCKEILLAERWFYDGGAINSLAPVAYVQVNFDNLLWRFLLYLRNLDWRWFYMRISERLVVQLITCFVEPFIHNCFVYSCFRKWFSS